MCRAQPKLGKNTSPFCFDSLELFGRGTTNIPLFDKPFGRCCTAIGHPAFVDSGRSMRSLPLPFRSKPQPRFPAKHGSGNWHRKPAEHKQVGFNNCIPEPCIRKAFNSNKSPQTTTRIDTAFRCYRKLGVFVRL